MREIQEKLIAGATQTEIAREMGISRVTVYKVKGLSQNPGDHSLFFQNSEYAASGSSAYAAQH